MMLQAIRLGVINEQSQPVGSAHTIGQLGMCYPRICQILHQHENAMDNLSQFAFDVSHIIQS